MHIHKIHVFRAVRSSMVLVFVGFTAIAGFWLGWSAHLAGFTHTAQLLSNTCGNDVLDSSEQCDDGNVVGGDGCSPDCKIEPSFSKCEPIECPGGVKRPRCFYDGKPIGYPGDPCTYNNLFCYDSNECLTGEKCSNEVGFCLPDPECPDCNTCLGLCSTFSNTNENTQSVEPVEPNEPVEGAPSEPNLVAPIPTEVSQPVAPRPVVDTSCNPFECSDGRTIPRCSEAGKKIFYNGNPCSNNKLFCTTSAGCSPGYQCTTELGDCLPNPSDPNGGSCAGTCLLTDPSKVQEPTPPVAPEAEPTVVQPPKTVEDLLLEQREFGALPEPTKNWFTDTDLQYEGDKAANLLRDWNIIHGYADGSFKASRPVNRAEAAKFLLTARYGEFPQTPNSGRFYDIATGVWFVKYVMGAANLGIIQGYGDGSFRPANTINSAEFAKMLVKTFQLETGLPYYFQDVDPSAWFAQYVGVVERHNMFPTRIRNFEPERLMTRGEVALAIARAVLLKQQ